MLRISRYFLFIGLVLFVFSACNKVPDHARYIPKDAILVSGVNIKSLGKKIAWEVLTGSKIFKDMQNRVPEKGGNPDALSGLDKAGIDLMNTIYAYVKTDKRYSSGNSVTILVPLSDASKWETWVKKAFPKSEIKERNGRKETSFGSMYMGWNKNLLMVINAKGSTDQYMSMIKDNNLGAALSPEELTELSADIEKDFNIPKENSLLENKKFDSLQKVGHDISLWLNYEELMDQYGSNSMAQVTGGVAISKTLWKNAAMAIGFDFEKGKISGDMQYFMPDKLIEVGKELGANNADKEMMQKLPTDNLNMLLATHFSLKGFKAMMDSSGLTGMANSSLTAANLTIDSIFDAFSGDFAFNINDLTINNKDEHKSVTVNMNLVLKINKPDNFNKLYQMAIGLLQGFIPNMKMQNDNSFYIPVDNDAKDTIIFMKDDKFAIISNKMSNVTGFFKGDFVSHKSNQASYDQITAHPWSMFFDMQQLAKNINVNGMNMSIPDSAKFEESRKLLKSICFNGGEFKNNALNYQLNINFMNESENSLLTLLGYGIKMQDADKMSKDANKSTSSNTNINQ